MGLRKMICAVILAALFSFAAAAGGAQVSPNEFIQGSCGENLIWTFDSDIGSLKISGTGDMYNFPSFRLVPWSRYAAIIRTINVAEGVTGIGGFAFSRCDRVVSVVLPESVAALGNRAFCECQALETVTFGGGLVSIGAHAFESCPSLVSVELPEGLLSIGEGAFRSCASLASVSLPESLESLGASAFYGCVSLGSIELPDGLSSIAENTFSGCENLASVRLPANLLSIGDSAFSGTRIVSFDFPEGLLSIGDWAIGSRVLRTVELPDSLVHLGLGAFTGCPELFSFGVGKDNAAFSSVDGVLFDKTGGTLLAYPCGRGFIYNVPEGVTRIGDYAFCKSQLLHVASLPSSVTSVGVHAFYECTVMSLLTFSDGLVEIGDGAFEKCIGLGSLELPANVTSIGDRAFRSCSQLTRARFGGAPPAGFGEDVFDGCAEDFLITYLPEYAAAWAPDGETEWNGWPISPLFQTGDADLDGTVGVSDALLALRGAMGLVQLSPEQAACADFDGSGELEMNDALNILRFVMGIASGYREGAFMPSADVYHSLGKRLG